MPEKNLRKELIKKEDGRYLYLYTWSKGKKAKSKPSTASRAPAESAEKKR